MLQNNPELKSKIDQLWNKFWSGGISNPLTAIEQITYLLFMKRLDELDQKKQADAEWTGEKYTSKFEGTWIPPEYRAKLRDGDTQNETDKKLADGKMYEIDKRTLRWSEFKRMQAEDMLQHVQGKVFPFLKELNGAESNFTHHMKNAVFIIPKPALLVEAVKTIDEIFEVMEKDSRDNGQAFQDIQGDVYEMLLSEIASRRQKRPVPHPAPHHQADGRSGAAATGPQHCRSGLWFRRLFAGSLSIHCHPTGAKSRSQRPANR